MSQTPTINQYLLDLLVAGRIAAAEKTKDPKAIAKANRDYKDLKESEVTFGPWARDTKTGVNSVKLVAKSRNWTIEKMTFNTGTLAGLSRKNQQGAALISALDLVSIPSLIYVQENDSRYLAVDDGANVFESLKLTGYEFPANSFVPTIYGKPKEDSKAVGQVDIDHPIVAGRFLLYYITSSAKKGSDDNKVQPTDQETTDLSLKGETNVSSDNTQDQAQANSNEGDQANPGSTQTELKTPKEPGQSAPTAGDTQGNSADGTADPVETAKENEQTAKENAEGFEEKKQQNKVK